MGGAQMITHGEDVEIHALRTQGWSISAIARHTGLDRKTIRAYLSGQRAVGVRRSSAADPFEEVEAYVPQRPADDPHVRATVLFGEVRALGYGQSYPTFVRRVRHRGLRPSCQACSPGRPSCPSVCASSPALAVSWAWPGRSPPSRRWSWAWPPTTGTSSTTSSCRKTALL